MKWGSFSGFLFYKFEELRKKRFSEVEHDRVVFEFIWILVPKKMYHSIQLPIL